MLKRITKVLTTSILCFSFAHADAVDAMVDVAKHGITKAAEVAMKDTTETKANDVTQVVDIDMKESFVTDGVGNHISGDKIDVNHIKQTAKIRMERSAAIGKVGNSIGQ